MGIENPVANQNDWPVTTDGARAGCWQLAGRIASSMNGLNSGLTLLAIVTLLMPSQYWVHMARGLISASIWSKEWCIGRFWRNWDSNDAGARLEIGRPKSVCSSKLQCRSDGHSHSSRLKAPRLARFWRETPRAAATIYLLNELVRTWRGT